MNLQHSEIRKQNETLILQTNNLPEKEKAEAKAYNAFIILKMF